MRDIYLNIKYFKGNKCFPTKKSKAVINGIRSLLVSMKVYEKYENFLILAYENI